MAYVLTKGDTVCMWEYKVVMGKIFFMQVTPFIV